MILQHETPFRYNLEPLARGRAAAVVAAEIGQHLLALEHRGHARLAATRAIRGNIRAIAAARQTHLDTTR
jgi:hypothetical protein